MTQIETDKLKLNQNKILKNNVVNLNIKDIPEKFNFWDIELLVKEVINDVILINLPYNKQRKSFHEYCFVLFNSSEKAAEFCEMWNQKTVMDTFGNFRTLNFHQGNNSPRDVILRVLTSRVMSEDVKIKFQNNELKPRFYLQTKEKVKSFLKILNCSSNSFIKKFPILKNNPDFKILFNEKKS